MSHLYRVLLFAYPASFRRRFGRAMIEANEDELAELRARAGVAALVRGLGRMVRDTLTTAAAMRWTRWRGRPGAPLSQRETASWSWRRRTGPGEPELPPPASSASVGGPGAWGDAIIDSILIDLKFALRSLYRNPGFGIAAVLTLVIAIGANTTIFALVDALLLQRPALLEPDRLVSLTERMATNDGRLTPFAVSPANFVDWRSRNGVFSGMSATLLASATLGDDADALDLNGLRVSANFFDVLGAPAALGRTFRPEEEPPDAPAVVVISDGLWRRAFAGDPSVIGREVLLAGAPHTIIGVMPPDFAFVTATGPNVDAQERDFWMLDPFGSRGPGERRYRILGVVARLAPGVDIEQAREEMQAIAGALADEYPDINRNRLTGDANGVSVNDYHLFLVRNVRPALLMLAGAVGFVLAIACTNIANLLLVRSTARRGEIAVRRAIGAGRLRLARQMLTESSLLAALGGVGGLVLAWLAVPGLVMLAPMTTPPSLLRDIEIDGRVLVFAALTSLVAALAFGVAPALRSAGSGPGPARGGAAGTGARRRRGRGKELVVAAQIALALVLLVGVGLLMATFARLYSLPLGFDPDGVVVAWTNAGGGVQSPGNAGGAPIDSARAIVERLESHPEVRSAAAVGLLPFWGNANGSELHIEGRPSGAVEPDGSAATVDASGNPDRSLLRAATPGYFDTIRVPLLLGRDLSWSDDVAAPRVAVINEAMAEAYFAGESPLGRRVTIVGRRAPDGEPFAPVEIIGVVGNVWELSHYLFNSNRLGSAFVPTMYLPAREGTIVARFADGVQASPALIRSVIDEVDPQRKVSLIDTLASYVDQMLVAGELRLSAVVIGALAVVALLLAAMGVYGTMAFLVASRTREIGVRMALGARGRSIVGTMVAQGLRTAVLGTLGGILIAYGTTHLLSRWLYQVSPTDLFTFATLSTAMMLVASIACWIPARRAARVDPVASLRADY